MIRTLLFLAALAVSLPHASAGEPDLTAHPLNPASQPLLVVRANKAATVTELLETRQVRALGLDRKDFSGQIPGVGAKIDSLREFVVALGYGKAGNLWYCLTQEGSSLARQTGAMGWDAADAQPGADPERVEEWLRQMGLDVKGRDVELRPQSSDRLRLIVSRDAAARQEIMEGFGQASGAWKRTLSTFVNGREGTVGVLANTRPLLGLLSLITGIDFRSKITSHKMEVPVSTQAELFNNQGDLGFELRLNNIIPEGGWPVDGQQQVLISSRPDALVELNFPAPGSFRELLDINNDVFFLANINILPLIPRSVNFSAWRKDNGELAWSLVCLMADKEKFNAQLRRVLSWLEIIHTATGSSLGLARATTPSGQEVVTLNAGELSLAIGEAGAVGNSAYLILSGTAEDWPNPDDIRMKAADAPCLVDFRSNLDAASRQDVLTALADLSQKEKWGLDRATLDAMMPDKDSGYIGMDGDSLVLLSRNGQIPLLCPALLELHKFDPNALELKQVASRLRYLLDIASQSRFLGLGSGGARQTDLPSSVADLLNLGSGGDSWLAKTFGEFPGSAMSAIDALSAIASGRSVDGFTYDIDNADGRWQVTAENGDGLVLRLDADGAMNIRDEKNNVSLREPVLGYQKIAQ